MSKSKELWSTTNLVKAILEQDVRARNSDNFLYLRVLGVLGEKNGIDINTMSIPTFLLNLQRYGFPPFETVRRSRAKLQAMYPELAADANVQAQRMVNEDAFRSYANSNL